MRQKYRVPKNDAFELDFMAQTVLQRRWIEVRVPEYESAQLQLSISLKEGVV